MNSSVIEYRKAIVDWVESEVVDLKDTSAKCIAFCRWCFENLFDLSNDQALDAMEVAGAADHGIDAFVLDDEQLLVLQTKYESSHSWSEVTRFHYDMQRIKDLQVRAEDSNDRAARIIADIQDAYKMGWEVSYYYVTSNEFSKMEQSKLSSLKGINADFYFFDANSIAQKLETKQQDIPDTIKDKWFELKLASREILKFAEKTAVIAVSLADMHDLVARGGNELFASNVRQYLRGTKINTGIRTTIQKNPEQFWLYNNGITVVCDDFEEAGLTRACLQSTTRR